MQLGPIECSGGIFPRWMSIALDKLGCFLFMDIHENLAMVLEMSNWLLNDIMVCLG